MSFVVDNSVALTWCFEDDQTSTTAALLERVGETGAFAPNLWPIEALNGLLVAERRGRLYTARRNLLLRFLQMLPIALDADASTQVWTATVSLAERFRLSAYDATYLELAYRLGLPLASLDRALRSAASWLGVALLA